MQKWNFKTKKYEPYSVPDDWHCPITTSNMKEVVNCACCGCLMFFGDGYTSKAIHTDYGIGYTVCSNCSYDEYVMQKTNED